MFVFGSNGTGFHGAGGAGQACRGDHRNNWREDAWFFAAMRGGDPIGKWATFGVARGHQIGREGQSYAIQTVTRAGARRSISRREIYNQLVDLWAFAESHLELTLLCTPIVCGYAGYTATEMGEVWEFLILKQGIKNIRLVGGPMR